MTLVEPTRRLLHHALELYQDNPRAVGWLRRQLGRFDEPLRLAVAGPPGSGKTTLARTIEDLPDLVVLDTPADAPLPGIVADADALLYLSRRPETTNVAALHAVHAAPVAMTAPVNVLVVLAHADELGAGRVDALVSARQLARTHRKEPEIRELCQDVIAVSGLAALAALTIADDEFGALATLARMPKAELDDRLLSVDRFAADGPLPVSAVLRDQLLARFGLFGVRLSITLIRRGAANPVELAGQLDQRSGLRELRAAIAEHLTARAGVLKARSALIALEVLLRREPRPAGPALAAELDRILAGGHDLRELRLLAALRGGRVSLPDELREEGIRLAGGHGTAPAVRLGVDGPAGRQAAHDALWRWRRFLAEPSLDTHQRRAAATVVRTCEGLLAG